MNRNQTVQKIREGGYAVVMTALMLVPLMGFAGFAVDVGAWYSRASAISRAADAAALAGVVWQPDFTAAEAAARTEASRNGFTHGVDGIEVNVTNTGNNELLVQIVDTQVDMYFAGLFLDNVAIGRQATAEYAAPVPMGSPTNFIGAGSQSFGTIPASNAWAGMMGHCSNSYWGDLLSLRTTDYTNSNCGSTPNPFHDAGGYRWIIDVKDSDPVDINIWDIGYCDDRTSAGLDNSLRDKKNALMRFTLYNRDSTPLTHEDNVTPANMLATYTGGIGEGCNAWSGPLVHGMQITGGAGQYVLTTEILDSTGAQVYADTADYAGQNYFSLWASSSANPTGCLTFDTASCPGIYADEWMPVRTDPSGNPAVFYLAEVGPEHAGKTLQVSMWDLGEGMKSVEILDPNGVALDFDYEAVYTLNGDSHSGSASATNCDYSSYCLNVQGSVFDGDLVEVQVPLGLDWSGYTDNWFEVRYVLDTKSVDWTTWSVQVVGDPVRLVE